MKARRRALGAAAAVVVALGLVGYFELRPREERYAEYARPDGQYRLLLFRRYSPFVGTSPGQGSDAPGRLVLIDKAGNALRETDVPMVQLVNEIDWQEKSVYVRDVVDWPVP